MLFTVVLLLFAVGVLTAWVAGLDNRISRVSKVAHRADDNIYRSNDATYKVLVKHERRILALEPAIPVAAADDHDDMC